MGASTPLVMVDASKVTERRASHPIMKQRRTPFIGPPLGQFYEPFELMKVPRQGEFDSIHLAPRMHAPDRAARDPLQYRSLQLGNIVMAPFCIHDCLHTHVRWGRGSFAYRAEGVPKWTKGFDSSFNPYTTPFAPLVPHNQTIRILLQAPAGFSYEAIARGPIAAGAWSVFMHHGLGYAQELSADGELLVPQARAAVEATAIAAAEYDFSVKDTFEPVTAANSYAAFYWRLRFGGPGFAPQERIAVLVPEACRKL